MPIAHSEGRYLADETLLTSLDKDRRITLRYCGPNGELSEEHNANGSSDAAAGVTNAKRNVMGLMPHPERCAEELLGNRDGLAIFESLQANL
jgi:phosphoribosylformylglycinamidine synthase